MKIYTILGAVALTAFTFSCTEEKLSENTNNATETPVVNALNSGDLKIAYYVEDSIVNGFTYYKETEASITAEGEKLQIKYEKLGQDLISYQQRMQAKVNSGELSYLSDEFQKIEPNINRKKQKISDFEQTYLIPFQQKQMQENQVLLNKIINGGERFAKKNGLSLFLVKKLGSQIAYIDGSMDMTSTFIEFLNDEQASFEKDLEGETAE